MFVGTDRMLVGTDCRLKLRDQLSNRPVIHTKLWTRFCIFCMSFVDVHQHFWFSRHPWVLC